MMVLTLLSRSHCHLCDDMASELTPLLDEFGATLEILDVDLYQALKERYGNQIPVLLHHEEELSSFVLDKDRLRQYFLRTTAR